jgi:hypothetical protein
MDWTSFLWFAAALVLLLLLERWIHRHLQGTMLLLTGDPDIAVWLYAIPLLPGVALHEISHAIAGWLLGAHVGRISIFPARADGRVQLGFVPVEKMGLVRTALVGLAPLVVGCLVLVFIGFKGLQLGSAVDALVEQDWPALIDGVQEVFQAPGMWIWAYLAFAVSNTMLPSRSDMRAWPAIALFLAIVAGLVVLLDLGSVLMEPLAGGLRWLAVACGLTVLIDLPFALTILVLEMAMGRLKGMRVEYG